MIQVVLAANPSKLQKKGVPHQHHRHTCLNESTGMTLRVRDQYFAFEELLAGL